MIRILLTLALVLVPEIGLSYLSRTGRFSCPNPLEKTLGPKTDEGPAYVSFYNDFGERYRVETTPIDETSRRLLKEHGRAAFLEAMIKGYYFPELMKRAVPRAELLSGSYMHDLRGGAYIAQVSLPGGGLEKTHIDVQTGKRTVTRLDTVRSVLVFLENDRLVFVSSELSPIRPDQDRPVVAEDGKRAIRLTQQTIAFAKQITLH